MFFLLMPNMVLYGNRCYRGMIDFWVSLFQVPIFGGNSHSKWQVVKFLDFLARKSRWWFSNIFFNFHPFPGKMIQVDEHIFQMD